jgi:hypothetical protein
MHKAIILAKFYFLSLLGNFLAVGQELDKGVSLSPGVPRHLPESKNAQICYPRDGREDEFELA